MCGDVSKLNFQLLAVTSGLVVAIFSANPLRAETQKTESAIAAAPTDVLALDVPAAPVVKPEALEEETPESVDLAQPDPADLDDAPAIVPTIERVDGPDTISTFPLESHNTSADSLNTASVELSEAIPAAAPDIELPPVLPEQRSVAQAAEESTEDVTVPDVPESSEPETVPEAPVDLPDSEASADTESEASVDAETDETEAESDPNAIPAVPSGPVVAPAAPPSEAEQRVLVAEINISGERVDLDLERLVFNAIGTRPGRTTTRSQLQEDIDAIYATGFFSNVRVVPEDTPLGVRINYVVTANPPLSAVRIETVPEGGTQAIPPETVDEIFGEGFGDILNLQTLQQEIQVLNQWYTENGFDLAQVVGSPEISPDGVVTLRVAEGVIENIEVRYFDEEDEPVDGKTRPYIVTREFQLKPGDIFNRSIAQQDLQRVFGLGIFEDVRLSFSPGTDPRQVIINVDVIEGSSGSIAAGAGISSASGLFGTASFRQRNIGGNNQTLGAEVQIGTRDLLFDVSFTDPWIGGDPYRTSYSINAFRRRSISLVFDGENEIRTEDGDDRPRVVRTGGGINFNRPLADPYSDPEWTLNAGFQYQRVEIRNADGDIAPVSEDGENLAFSDDGKDDLFFLRFGALRDRRNDVLRPTSGSITRVNLDQTIPIGSGNILLSRVRASHSFYIPVKLLTFDFMEGRPQAFAFNIQGGTAIGDLPPYEAFVLGGSNSVRGYDDGDLGSGRSFLQATVEYRFPVISIVSGALFIDGGSTLGTGKDVPGEPSEVRDLPGSGVGYGAGVRVQTPIGPIRVDLGFNGEGDTEVHFGIGEKF
ncbi:MAG: BamA/TamA family outer membrane protein [Cyanobacteria bacterium P01_H01_bin.15]